MPFPLFIVSIGAAALELFFTGEHRVSLDKQRRLSIPVRWREDFRQSGGCFVTMEPLQHKSLYLYPSSVYKRVLKGIKASGKQNDPWVMAIMNSLIFAKESFDGHGRVILPKEFCDVASISKEALTIGRDSKIEVWAPSSFESSFKPAGLPPVHDGNLGYYDDIQF